MSTSEQTSKVSEPAFARLDRSKVPWYSPNIDKYLASDTQELLEKYSHIPRSEQSKHVHEIRDQAWDIRTYPCTGLGAWLAPYISRSPSYKVIIERLKNGETFIDVGCFVGMDMRRLVFDGAPSSKMYGVDIVSHWDVGFELFRDKDRFQATFIECDIFDDKGALKSLTHKVDIISCSAVLHLFDWNGQIEVAKKLVSLSIPGSLIVGHQIGCLKGRTVDNKNLRTQTYSHDPESFKRLWDQVGQETGTVWETEARLVSWEYVGWHASDMKWMDPDNRVIDFVVTRLA